MFILLSVSKVDAPQYNLGAHLLFNIFLVLIYSIPLSKDKQVAFIILFVQFENICTIRGVQEDFRLILALGHLALFH